MYPLDPEGSSVYKTPTSFPSLHSFHTVLSIFSLFVLVCVQPNLSPPHPPLGWLLASIIRSSDSVDTLFVCLFCLFFFR
ncbi:hypothetical protein J3E72DRAFT_276457, partial [Bipolaris maydis]|uniref:uncharacterized protein n=1 Tax=Cochliobolus heterostrophus TaxID=5016 RepID=UPI0024D60F50